MLCCGLHSSPFTSPPLVVVPENLNLSLAWIQCIQALRCGGNFLVQLLGRWQESEGSGQFVPVGGLAGRLLRTITRRTLIFLLLLLLLLLLVLIFLLLLLLPLLLCAFV